MIPGVLMEGNILERGRFKINKVSPLGSVCPEVYVVVGELLSLP
jgi:hypothetical protein